MHALLLKAYVKAILAWNAPDIKKSILGPTELESWNEEEGLWDNEVLWMLPDNTYGQ